MANVAHSTLALAEVHEPKGIAAASAGEVYVADGSGSGTWAGVGTSSFTGMIADFTWPVVQEGWLECDGSTISTSTYSVLYNVMSIASSGSRTNGSPTITSIPSTTNFRAGYYVFGAGIASGTTILTVDSPAQVTLSGNASSSGTSAFAVSPWLLNTGTIKLPDVSAAGRYRRSRSSSFGKVGDLQSDSIKGHTHTVSGTTNDPGNHTHINSLTDPGHVHNLQSNGAQRSGQLVSSGSGSAGQGVIALPDTGSAVTGIVINNAAAGAHTHTVTGTAASDGYPETRPTTLVVMTCVKT